MIYNYVEYLYNIRQNCTILSNREAGQHRELKGSFISLGAPNFQKAQETAYKKKSYLETIIQVALNSIK